MMMLTFSVWMIINHVIGLITGYCLYGDSSDCVFQCHCAVDSECSQGTCPSGCKGAPPGYNWRGTACQIGNVGLNKSANMTVEGEYTTRYPAKAALDGVNPGPISPRCAYPFHPQHNPAEWWTDLGDVYKIFNITIYGRTDCCAERLQQFTLNVYNTSDNEVLCGYHEDSISNYATIRCTTPVIGRYVHFKRTGGPDIYQTTLCEVVIIGHKYIDCSYCPVGVSCNDVTGCDECSGSYQPDCKQECGNGFYGSNCKHQCGKCKTDNKCDKINGTCYDGCQMWWTNTKCDKNIELPKRSNETRTVKRKTSRSILVEWQHIGVSKDLLGFYGYLIQYKEATKNSTYIEAGIANYTSEPMFMIENLKLNTLYAIQIKPFRKYGMKNEFGTSYPILEVKTNCAKPQRVSKINVTSLQDDKGIPEISVTWQMISEIEANCDNITKLYLLHKLKASTNYTIIDLHPDISHFVIAPHEEGEYEVKLIVENNEGYKSNTDIFRITLKSTKAQFTASTLKTTIIAGSVSVFVIVVILLSVITVIIFRRRKSRTRMQASVHDNAAFQHTSRNEDGNMAINEMDTTLDNITNQGRINHQTVDNNMADKSVYELEKAVEDEEATEKHPNLTVENVTVYSNVDIEMEESIYVNSAVAVKSFEGYLARRIKKIDDFSDEFKSLPLPDFERCNAARTTKNREKNRYRTVLAYDDTRVILRDGSEGDYINATYITGYNRKKEYIATQAPRDITIVDFWQMIWQEQANSIVMVANLSEGGRKADRYWPETIGESLKLGDFKVTTKGLHNTADYFIRIMTLEKRDESHTIRQFHFTSWPDKDHPLHGHHTLLEFLDRIHSFDNVSNGPVVVHCSAGIGRTGTFIAFDILRQMAIKRGSLDVYNCVKKLRHERMLMVQTMAQYVFLHEILVDFIKCGNRSISCTEFQSKFRTICAHNPDKQILACIEDEFSILKDLKGSDDNRKKDGLKPTNIQKNRNIDIVPNELDRLFLSRSKTGNYINAVPVDTFKSHDSLVVTQMPLPHTITDFWQLIVEKRCQTIVMLNGMDNENQKCVHYWPEELNTEQMYGRVQVELTSIMRDYCLIVRDLKITEETTKKTLYKPEVLEVRQFQLLSWPEDNEVPPDRADLLHLMDNLHNWQQHNQIPADQWKTLVHCIDGGSRSGMFCGASFMIEKMKTDQEVNAFLAVRYVIRHRPQFFTQMYEYQFLYQMAMEYLNTHSEYSNFR